MNYRKRFWILTIVLAGVILLSCCIGRYELSISDILGILMGKGGNLMDEKLFLQIRLPRTFFVVLSGGALALAGMVYQSVFQNPLVSPDVLGVSSGCSVGGIIGILMFGHSIVISQFLTFGLGLLAVAAAMLLASCMGGNKRYLMIIAGIIVGALANSVIVLLKYMADPNRDLPAIEYWLMGSFQNADWDSVLRIFPIAVLSVVILFLYRWKMKVLILGDEEADSLGVSPHIVRNISLICATILVAVVVSEAGVVAWIGLIAPHLIRMFCGEDYIKNFFPCILLGGILLLAADICSRSIAAAEIPVSIFTSFFGAAVLTIFLVKGRKDHGNQS